MIIGRYDTGFFYFLFFRYWIVAWIYKLLYGSNSCRYSNLLCSEASGSYRQGISGIRQVLEYSTGTVLVSIRYNAKEREGREEKCHTRPEDTRK